MSPKTSKTEPPRFPSQNNVWALSTPQPAASAQQCPSVKHRHPNSRLAIPPPCHARRNRSGLGAKQRLGELVHSRLDNPAFPVLPQRMTTPRPNSQALHPRIHPRLPSRQGSSGDSRQDQREKKMQCCLASLDFLQDGGGMRNRTIRQFPKPFQEEETDRLGRSLACSILRRSDRLGHGLLLVVMGHDI